MLVLETVALTLGISISRAILKAWKVDGSAADLSSDALELLKAFGIDAATQRKSRRQLEEIGKQVGDRTRSLFERERSSMEGSSYKAVVLEVAATLAKTRIDADLLIQLNLSPERLASYLIESRSHALLIEAQSHATLNKTQSHATNLFTAEETEFYNRFILEVSRAMMEVASQLSGFARSSWGRTLEGQSKILGILDKLLVQADEVEKKFEDRYREEISRKLDRMDLIGVRRIDVLQRSQSLSVSYILLHVEQYSDHRSPRKDGHNLRTITNSGRELQDEEEETRKTDSRTLDQIISGSRRLVIRGDAGSGKTTFLQWLAVRSARQDFPPYLVTWNRSIPLFIRLRECVENGFPSTQELPSLAAPMISGSMPVGWVHRQLEIGRALVLVDGVDELPRDKRAKMLERLTELVSAYPLARYVVTSRPSALKTDNWPEWKEWITSEDFVDVSLLPMGPAQINSFIDHWHAAVGEAVADEDERWELENLPGNLKRLLRQRPALRRLTTSPLLCAMICALHRDRRQRLPSERIKLYEQCCEILLTGRDDTRHIAAVPDYPDLSDAQKLALVQSFAYWLMLNGWSDIESEQADEFFTKRLHLMNLPGITGERVREYFVERTSLLREPIHGRIDFRHRTFQEFLGAQAAIREGDIGVLLRHATDDQWREMIVLAAGVARPKECERLLIDLVRRGNELEQRKHQVLLLAIACLETTVEVEPAIREQVINSAAKLFPPSSMDEAKVVAAPGDPVVPLLAPDPTYSEEVAASCVRALSIIGTDRALSAIEAYGSDHRRAVKTEIGAAWDSFDRGVYASRVLIQSDHLLLPNFSGWDGFEHLSHLREIEFGSGLPLTELARLAQCVDLVKLSLHNSTETHNLTPIQAFTHLRALNLTGGFEQLRDISPLSKLKDLERLFLGQFTCLKDISPLEKLSNLHLLTLWHCESLTDLEPIRIMPKLTGLEFFDCSSIYDISALSTLTSLQRLTLYHCTRLEDITPIVELRSLIEINLSECYSIVDFSPLTKLPKLRRLIVKGLSEAKVKQLRELRNVEIFGP